MSSPGEDDTVTEVLSRVPVGKVAAHAREVSFGHAVLTLVTGLFFGLGWVLAKLLGGAWLALAWAAKSVQLGWHEGHGRRELLPPARVLVQENDELRAEVARLSGR